MREILEIPIADILPKPHEVLGQQGVPEEFDSGPAFGVAEEACHLLTPLLEPRGIVADIDTSTFESIYPGRGENSPQSPLAEIFPQAENMALFAVTAGPAVTNRISLLFANHDYPLAAALDAAASLAADQAANWVQERFSTRYDPDHGVLRYSPGYCGWHVSGQIKLFAVLAPDSIGISLGESCLMEPLKSVSGVLVAGPAHIHDFTPNYSFCSHCAEHQCRARIEMVLAPDRKDS